MDPVKLKSSRTLLKTPILKVTAREGWMQYIEQPYPHGSLGTMRSVLRHKNQLFLAIPHMNAIYKITFIDAIGRRCFLVGSPTRYDTTPNSVNVDSRNNDNNNFIFRNYFLAWAYVQKWRAVNE